MDYTFPVPSSEFEERNIVESNTRNPTKISDEIERFFLSYANSTMLNYRADLHAFWTFTGKPFQNTTKDDVLRYIDYLDKKKLKNSTINRKLAALSTIMSLYNSKKLMSHHPIHDISATGKIYRPTDPSVEINITKHDVEAVVSNSNKRVSTLVQLLANTGLRVSEAINIKLEDLEPYDNQWLRIKVTKAKGGKIRFCFISYQLFQDIKEAYDYGSIYLLSARSGNQLSRINVYKQIRRVFKKHTGKETSPHQIRHLFATIKIRDEKKDYKAVSTYLGHASVSTTLNIYTSSSLSPEETVII